MGDSWWQRLLFGNSGNGGVNPQRQNPQLSNPISMSSYNPSSTETERIIKALTSGGTYSPTVPQDITTLFGGPSGGSPNADMSQNRPHDVNRYGSLKNYDNYSKWLQGSVYGGAAGGAAAPEESLRDSLLKQLLAGLDSGRPATRTPDQIKKEASSAIGMQFNPQIKTIQQLMTDARRDGGVNSKDIKALYADLAGTYKADAASTKKEIAAARAEEAKALGGLQGRTDKQYDGQMADQIEEFQKLGIDAALPSATQGQVDDRAFLEGINDTESSAQQRFLTDMGLSETNYYNRGAGIAKQRGAESVESLLGNLDQYLKQEGGELSALQGQKGSAIAQLVQQMTQANNTAYGDWDSDRWSKMAQVLGIVNSSNNQDFNQQLALAKLQAAGGNGTKTPVKGIEGAYGVLQQLLGGNSTNATSALQNFLQSQTQREGSFRDPNNQPVDMTPQQAAFEARKYGAQMKLSAPEIDALVQSVYAYYGKLS